MSLLHCAEPFRVHVSLLNVSPHTVLVTPACPDEALGFRGLLRYGPVTPFESTAVMKHLMNRTSPFISLKGISPVTPLIPSYSLHITALVKMTPHT